MVLRLHKAAANSKGERRNEGCDIPADNHAPDVGLIGLAIGRPKIRLNLKKI